MMSCSMLQGNGLVNDRFAMTPAKPRRNNLIYTSVRFWVLIFCRKTVKLTAASAATPCPQAIHKPDPQNAFPGEGFRKKTVKFLMFGVVTMLVGSVCFAQDNLYPDVWWREVPSHLKAKGFGLSFLAVEKIYEANPSESPEIYMVMERRSPSRQQKNAERVFAIQGFFSGKQWRVKQAVFGVENIPEKFRLNDGRWIELGML